MMEKVNTILIGGALAFTFLKVQGNNVGKSLIDEENLYALIVFDDEEISIAIGRNGQNIQLASDITGYTIDSIKLSEYNLYSIHRASHKT